MKHLRSSYYSNSESIDTFYPDNRMVDWMPTRPVGKCKFLDQDRRLQWGKKVELGEEGSRLCEVTTRSV